MTQRLALLVVSLAAVASLPASAQAEIRVTYPGGGETVITDAQLRDELDLDANPLRWWPSGFPGPALVNVPGMSTAEVVRRAGVEPASLSATSAMTIGGEGSAATQTLTRAEVIGPFPDVVDPANAAGGGQAVFFSNGGSVVTDPKRVDFIRPVRSAADSAYPGATRFIFPDGVSVTLALAGAVLPVSIAAPATAKADRDVAYTAAVGAHSGLTYSWDFGDGGTSSQAAPSHRYAVPGTYKVRVTIGDGSGGAGVATKLIAIGPADGDDGEAAPGSTDLPHDAQRGGGTGPEQASILGPTSTPDGRSDVTNPPSRVTTRARTAPAPSVTSAPADATGRDSERAGSGGGSAGGTTTSDTTSLSQHGAAHTARGGGARRVQPHRTPGTSGQSHGTISGFVLAGSGAPIAVDRPPADERVLTRREQSAARAGTGGSPGWPAWIGMAAVLVALAVAGVARETVPTSGPRLIYP